MQKKNAAYYTSKALSYILHPFLMPVYLLALLFLTNSLPAYMTEALQKYIVGVVIVCVICIPAMAIIMMRLLRLIDNYSLATRRDRILPLVVVSICYGLTAVIFGAIPILSLLHNLMVAAAACSLFAFAVNFFWQISLHMISMGAATGIVYMLLLGGSANFTWLLVLLIILSGALGSARLYLRKHSPAQVGAGYASGLFISMLVLLALS